jgi:RHS repeat-associated protein
VADKLGSKTGLDCNHLGNVLAVVSDLKVTQDGLNYEPLVLSATDYYPFGMQMPGRTFSSPAYRYGFNGMEKDDEVKGSGNFMDFGMRCYDPRIGRMFSNDPRAMEYAWQTTYAYHRNSPVSILDYLGGGAFPGAVDDEKTANFGASFKEEHKEAIAKEWDMKAVDTGKEAFEKGEISAQERELIKANNMARSNPAKYAAEFLLPEHEKMQKVDYQGQKIWVLNGQVQESANNLEAAITTMGNTEPLPIVKYSPSLSSATSDHTADGETNGITGHVGSDGSSPGVRAGKYAKWIFPADGKKHTLMAENISYDAPVVTGPNGTVNYSATALGHVTSLLIDNWNAQSDRGHRKNILNREWKTIGVSHTENHSGNGQPSKTVMSVTNFGIDHSAIKH